MVPTTVGNWMFIEHFAMHLKNVLTSADKGGAKNYILGI